MNKLKIQSENTILKHRKPKRKIFKSHVKNCKEQSALQV